MKVKTKIQLQGGLIGMATAGILMFIDKIILPWSIATYFAGDLEVLVWAVIAMMAVGTATQQAQKQVITSEKIDEIDKKK